MTNVLVFVGAYPPAFRAGGPIRAIEAMVARASSNFAPYIVTSDRDLGEPLPATVRRNTWVSRGVAKVNYVNLRSAAAVVRCLKMARAAKPGFLYFNSLFDPRLTMLPILLWRLGFWGPVTAVLAPRGELADQALRNRSPIKKIYLGIFRMLGLSRKVLWHSTSAQETTDICTMFGDKTAIVLRHDDILLPDNPPPLDRCTSKELRIVFIGRLTAHKGLHLALQGLIRAGCDTVMDIFGPEENAAYVRQCRQLAESMPSNVHVQFRGVVVPDQVVDTLAQYDVLLSPTASENFGYTIVEGLCASCIVVTTASTPWTQILEDGAGIVLDERSADAVADAIRQLAGLTTEELTQWRSRAREAYLTWLGNYHPEHLWNLVPLGDTR
ncbi:MAG: glycosyltransferase [Propionibacteriaceae bacterium]|nr:glycosyltransferase [Propionibacteriaceae bacterium]